MITRLLSRHFDSGVRSRGQSYYAQGFVELPPLDRSGLVLATVYGSSAYEVEIELDFDKRNWTLLADCTCPYGEAHGTFCKHIWATLLALDAQRYFERFGPLPQSIRIASMDFEDLEDLDDDGPEGEVRLSGSSRGLADQSAATLGMLSKVFPHLSRNGKRPASTPKPKPDGLVWLKQIGKQANDSYAPHSPRQQAGPVDPIYVLEGREAGIEGKFVLSLAQQSVTATGRLGKIKKLALAPADIPRLRDTQDRHICMMLVGAGIREDSHRYYGSLYYDSSPGQSKWRIPATVQGALLPLLTGSGRFRFRADTYDEPIQMVCDPGGLFELVLHLTPTSKPDLCSVSGRVRRGPELLDLRPTDCFIQGEPCLLVRNGVLSRVETHQCFRWIDALRNSRPSLVHKKELPQLLSTLAAFKAYPPVVWPPEWGVQEITDLDPRPELALNLDYQSRSWGRKEASAKLAFSYDTISADAGAPGACLADPKTARLIRRRPDVEDRFRMRLSELGVVQDRYDHHLVIPDKRIPALVATLLAEGWTILGNKQLYRRPGELSIDVSTGIDWFDVKGGVEFDGQFVPFPALLEALRKNERFVRLGDGSLGMLPEEWLKQHRRWLEMGEAKDGSVRFTKTQIGLIDALLAEMPQATFDENLAAARQRLNRFEGVAPRAEPEGFVGQLRDYQREGLGWLNFLNEFDWGGCLADDMGLGKTVQLLALLAERKRSGDNRPSLVIAPKSVVFNWAREAERFAPKLRVLNYTGLERKAHRDGIDGHDLVLTTYGTLRRDIEVLRNREFNYAVLDEAQAIKNPNSQSAKAVRLLKARRRLVMTGTPVENHLGDLWSLFEFLNPGMLGPQAAFRGLAGGAKSSEADPATLRMVQRMLRPFILRRTKEQVAPELPSRMEQTIPCEMGKQQTAHYNELRDHYRASVLAKVDKQGLAKSQMHVLEALLRLRQAACHPGLIDPLKRESESAKLEALLPMIDELIEGGHKALVFSQFTSLLSIVREALGKKGVTYEYLDGKTSKREKCVDRFQSDPKCPLFLISLKAGGVGLNLTAADYVFILDPWWNPAVEAQAIDRTHRIGQDKKVIAYRLIAQNTVEDKILQLQKSKRDLAEAIITEDNSLIRKLTRDDLAVLLS